LITNIGICEEIVCWRCELSYLIHEHNKQIEKTKAIIYIMRRTITCILKILSPIWHKLRKSHTGGNILIKYTILIIISIIENKILDLGNNFSFHSSNSFIDEKIVPYRLKCAYS
jgi:hypothetical protein